MNQITIPTLESSITNFPQLESTPEASHQLPELKVNGVAKISSHVTDNGIMVRVNNKSFQLRYPPSIWRRFPKVHRKILAENLTYGTTFHLPYLYTSLKRVQYSSPVPLSEAFFFKGLSLALPSTAIMQSQKDKRVTSNLLRRLFDIDYVFSNKKTEIPPYNRTSLSDHSIMPFTFGKDSLLTFALARELGLSMYPVYISEPDYPFEETTKKLLAEPFKKEFKVQILFLKNNLGVFREPSGWFGWELQLTHYSLMLLPYVYAKRAGYILFSNEQSCDDTITDTDGFKCNPVYEQSHGWLLQNSLMASLVGGNSLSIGTLLEPLYELAIEKILHTRYPEIAKYQSSCDLEVKPKNNGRWCQACSKCARIYVFLLAIGVDPKRVGFSNKLLSYRYRNLYSIFTTNKVRAYGYDQSEAGKDEQLFAFYLAYKKGVKGPLMSDFVRHYLRYVMNREKQFRRKFFGIHSTKTIPAPFKQKVLRIFRQELADLM